MNDEEFGRTIHQRMVDGDAVASEELCARWLEPLVEELSRAFLGVARRDPALIEQAVIDAVFDYVERPAIYRPDLGVLRKFLYFAARRDLQNALDSLGRRDARERPLEVVEDSSGWRNDRQADRDTSLGVEESVVEEAEWRDYWQLVAPHFPEERDRQILALHFQGERKTGPYSTVLGIDHLDFAAQQREVKRHKDRIGKRLRRLGEKLREQWQP